MVSHRRRPSQDVSAAPHAPYRRVSNRLVWMLAAAGLMVAGFAPLGLTVAGWLAVAPWCVLASRIHRARTAFGIGYLLGLAFLGTGCFWLTRAHPMNLVGMALAESAFFGLLLVLLRGGGRRMPFWIVAPVVFVGVEWLRCNVPLDGYPWLLLGYTQACWETLVQAADLAGVHGISFLLALSGGLLADTWLSFKGEVPRTRRSLLVGWGLGVGLVGGTLLYGNLRRANLDQGPLGPPLVAVQANIPQELKRSQASPREIYQTHLRLTREGLARTEHVEGWPTLVVWSETMFPLELAAGVEPGAVWNRDHQPRTYEEAVEIEQELVIDDLIKPILQPINACLILGVPTLAGPSPAERRRYNSAILYNPDGTRAGIYHKMILVPGGEYLPAVDWLPFGQAIRGLVEGMAGFLPDLSPGESLDPLVLATPSGSLRLGISICYENIYARHVRALARRGADLLVNLSNEAWFKDSCEMDQMHAMSVFRAVETRRSLLRCTNTGITALYDPLGRSRRLVVGGADREVAGVFTARPHLCRAESLFVRWGNWLALAAAVGTGLLVLVGLFRRWTVTLRRDAPL